MAQNSSDTLLSYHSSAVVYWIEDHPQCGKEASNKILMTADRWLDIWIYMTAITVSSGLCKHCTGRQSSAVDNIN